MVVLSSDFVAKTDGKYFLFGEFLSLNMQGASTLWLILSGRFLAHGLTLVIIRVHHVQIVLHQQQNLDEHWYPIVPTLKIWVIICHPLIYKIQFTHPVVAVINEGGYCNGGAWILAPNLVDAGLIESCLACFSLIWTILFPTIWMGLTRNTSPLSIHLAIISSNLSIIQWKWLNLTFCSLISCSGAGGQTFVTCLLPCLVFFMSTL